MKCLTCFTCFGGGGEDVGTAAGQANMEHKANPEGMALLDPQTTAAAAPAAATHDMVDSRIDPHDWHQLDALPHAVEDKRPVALQLPPQSKGVTDTVSNESSLSSEGVPGNLLTHMPQQQQQQDDWSRRDHHHQQQQQQPLHVIDSTELRIKLGLAKPLPSGELPPDAAAAAKACGAAAASGRTDQHAGMMSGAAVLPPPAAAVRAVQTSGRGRDTLSSRQAPTTAAGGGGRGKCGEVIGALSGAIPAAAGAAEAATAVSRPAGQLGLWADGVPQQQQPAAAAAAAGSNAAAGSRSRSADTIAAALAHINAAAAARDEECKRQYNYPAAAAAGGPSSLAAAPAAPVNRGQAGTAAPLAAAERPYPTATTLAPTGQYEQDLVTDRGMTTQSDLATSDITDHDHSGRSVRIDQATDDWSAPPAAAAAVATEHSTVRSAEAEEFTDDDQFYDTAAGASTSGHSSSSSSNRALQSAAARLSQHMPQQLLVLPRQVAQTLDLRISQIIIQISGLLLRCLDQGTRQLEKLPLPETPVSAYGSSSSSSRRGSERVEFRQMIRTLPRRTFQTLDMMGSQIVIQITRLLISGVYQAVTALDQIPLPAGSSSSRGRRLDLDLRRILRSLPGQTIRTLDLTASQITLMVTRSLLILLDLGPTWAQEISQALPGWLAAAATAANEVFHILLEVLGPGEESTRILDQSIAATRSLISGDLGVENLNAAAAAEGHLPLQESDVIAMTEGSGEWLMIDSVEQSTAAAAAAAASSTESGSVGMAAAGRSTAAEFTKDDSAVSDSTWELIKQAVPGSSSSISSRFRQGPPVTPHPSPIPIEMMTSPAAAAAAGAAAVPPFETQSEDSSSAAADRGARFGSSSSAIQIPSKAAQRAGDLRLYQTPPHSSSSSSSSSSSGGSDSGSSPTTPRVTPSTSAAAAGLRNRLPSQQQLSDAVSAAAATAAADISVGSTSSSSSGSSMQATAEDPPADMVANKQQQQQQHSEGMLPYRPATLPEERAAAAAAAAATSAAAFYVPRESSDPILLQQRSAHHGSQQQQQQQQQSVPAVAQVTEPASERFSLWVDHAEDADTPAAAAAAARISSNTLLGNEVLTEDWQDVSGMPDNQHYQQQQGASLDQQQQQRQKGVRFDDLRQQQQQAMPDQHVSTLVQEAQQYTSRLMQLLGGGGSRGDTTQTSGLDQQQQ